MKLRDLWVRLTLRGVHFSNRHGRLNELYRAENPWNLDSAKEKHRFEETNRIIAEAFGRPQRILEIGCGEGHQSEYLKRQCEELFGIDVAERAVDRAGRRLPDCQFERADLASSVLARTHTPFDLVVAAEVLYYVSDVEGTIRRMEEVGKACLVTYYSALDAKLGPILAGRSGANTRRFEFEGTVWQAHWWRP